MQRKRQLTWILLGLAWAFTSMAIEPPEQAMAEQRCQATQDSHSAQSENPNTLRISETLAEHTADVSSGRLLILGSPHLAQDYPDDFDPAWLDRLREVLVDFGPEIIAVEVLRPQDILTKRHLDDRRDDWDTVLDMFASGIIRLAESVREETGLDWATARQRQSTLLQLAKSDTLDAEERRTLVAASLAAYDYHTGLLHWAHMDTEARTPGNGLSKETANSLSNALESSNEAMQLGVHLAARLGLTRIHQIDDQLSLGIQTMSEHQQLAAALQETGIQKEMAARYREATPEALQHLREENDLLPLYRQLNSDDYAAFDIGTQWAAFFDQRVPQDLARTRMARREVRDLSIAANIREASARHPGKDMLVIIGASHRPFLQSYLSDMTDLDLITLEALLQD